MPETLGTQSAPAFNTRATLYAWLVGVAGQVVSTGKPRPLPIAADGLSVPISGTVTAAVSSNERTPSLTTISADGTIAAGYRKLTLIFSTDFAGTVLGGTFAGGTDYSLNLDPPDGDTGAAVAITRSAGSIRAIKFT